MLWIAVLSFVHFEVYLYWNSAAGKYDKMRQFQPNKVVVFRFVDICSSSRSFRSACTTQKKSFPILKIFVVWNDCLHPMGGQKRCSALMVPVPLEQIPGGSPVNCRRLAWVCRIWKPVLRVSLRYGLRPVFPSYWTRFAVFMQGLNYMYSSVSSIVWQIRTVLVLEALPRLVDAFKGLQPFFACGKRRNLATGLLAAGYWRKLPVF